MMGEPPGSKQCGSAAASDVYKRQAIYDGNAFHFFGPSSQYGGTSGLGATAATVENNKFRVKIRGVDYIKKAYGAVFKTDLTIFPFE